MKKIIVTTILALSLGLSYGQASKKDVKIERAADGDEKTQSYIQRQNQAIRIEEKDCGEIHAGTVLFNNSSKKDITVEMYDMKKEKLCAVQIDAGKSMYVKEVPMGEYSYRPAGAKKSKKGDRVNVMECMLKTVIITDKSFK